ncbi:hypothetical protein CRYUN_Cryun16bG0109800 [Craigia yunnanensis]
MQSCVTLSSLSFLSLPSQRPPINFPLKSISVKSSIEKTPTTKLKPTTPSKSTSWVSPNWLTSLTKSLTIGSNDDSGIPIASAQLEDVSEFLGGALFLPLFKWMNEYGPIYGLAAGSRNFVVVSNPAIAKHVRRRAVVPSLHKKYLSVMVDRVFCKCAERLVEKLQPFALDGTAIRALCKIVPRQIKAEKAVIVIRRTVEELIIKCKEIVENEGERIDEEEYVNDTDPSILRFLLASREEVSSSQLRYDLLSMLVAGHETTGSVLTWTLYLLSKRLMKSAGKNKLRAKHF